MYNFYAIETEADFRRREWERMAAADIQASQALIAGPKLRLRLPQFSFAALRSVAGPHLPFASSLIAPRRAVAATKLSDC